MELVVNLPETFWTGVIGSVIYGLLGIFLLLFGFKLFDWILPQIDFQVELKNNPIAVAIVIASFFLAMSHIVASAIH